MVRTWYQSDQTQLQKVWRSWLLLSWIYMRKYIKYICIFYHFSSMRWCRWLISSPVDDKDLFILNSQYHDCSWLGNARSQGISSMALTLFCWNVLVSASGELIHIHDSQFNELWQYGNKWEKFGLQIILQYNSCREKTLWITFLTSYHIQWQDILMAYCNSAPTTLLMNLS